jgi:mRNA-degrading endonuclease toxin of MazEF toxin-antitoxin module
MKYQVGDIVLVAEVLDRQGERPKSRPVLILDVTDVYLGAAITTQFGDPPAQHEILVHDGKKTNRTGLTKASVANAEWLFVFDEVQIALKLGHIMPNHLRLIQAYLNQE